MPETLSRLTDARSLAVVLDCHPRTIQRMAARGELPFIVVGRRKKYDVAEVLRALRQSEKGDS